MTRSRLMFADKHDWRCNAALCKPCLFTRPELLYSPSSKIVHLASAKKLLLARNLPSRRPLYDPASPAHLSPLSSHTRSDLQLPLHLLMNRHRRPRLLARKHILPRDSLVAPGQNLLVDARRRRPRQRHRPPLAVARDLELHAAADRLRHAKRASQRLHAERLARGFPVLEARFERVRRGWVGRARRGVVRVGADTGAERVVQAWGRGRALAALGDVAEGGGVRVRGDDAEGL